MKPTVEIRWVVRTLPTFGKSKPDTINILQQKWIDVGDKFCPEKEEWRDVSIVGESNE